MIRVVRKPPIGNANVERLKVRLNGNHTLKQKLCMIAQAKFWLHEHGIDNAGQTDLYVSLLDPNGYPLTNFADGSSIADFDLVIDSPYRCAADEYDRPPIRPPTFAPF